MMDYLKSKNQSFFIRRSISPDFYRRKSAYLLLQKINTSEKKYSSVTSPIVYRNIPNLNRIGAVNLEFLGAPTLIVGKTL